MISDHSSALKSDGSCWTWGNNSYGKLGDQTTASKSSPVLVVGDHSFIQLSTGSNHSSALKSDGSVWSWGNNFNGQLGDQTATNRSSPVLVVGDHSFMQIISIHNSTLALKSDGSIWSWGNNTSGQLGDETRTNRSSPVLVVGDHSFIDLPRDWIKQTGVTPQGRFAVFEFKNKSTGNLAFTVTWIGKSDTAPTVSTVYLQIYNRTTTLWETLTSNSAAAVDTNFTMTGTKTSNLTDYYDENGWISCRVYQQAL